MRVDPLRSATGLTCCCLSGKRLPQTPLNINLKRVQRRITCAGSKGLFTRCKYVNHIDIASAGAAASQSVLFDGPHWIWTDSETV